jgi:Abortive infection alpha
MQAMTNPTSSNVDTPIGQLPIQQLLPAVYQDVLAPGVKQLGIALESVMGLAPTLMLPLKYINEAAKLLLARRLEKLRQKLQDQPAANTTQIPPEIGVPVVEKLMHVKDESLAELYVQLLASAANTKTASVAHPSFVQLIANLSPDEAALLQLFQNPDDPQFWPYVKAQLEQLNDNDEAVSYIHLRGPLLGWEKVIHLQLPDNLPAYVENLVRCGFLSNEWGVLMSNHPKVDRGKRYETLKKLYRAEHGQPMQVRTRIGFTLGGVTLTEFGRLFIDCCVVARPEVFTGEKIDDSL